MRIPRDKRLWALAIVGAGSFGAFSTQEHVTPGEFVLDLALLAVGWVVVSGLVGVGALGRQFSPAAPEQDGPGSAGEDAVDQLVHLADLRASGAISNEEFEAEKTRILDL